MTRINLLPVAEPRVPRPVPRYVDAVAVAALAITLVSSGFYYAKQRRELREAEARRAILEQRIAEAQRELERSKAIARREAEAQRRERVLEMFAGRRWSPLLLELRSVVPLGVRFLSLDTDRDQATIRGTARNLSQVAALAVHLVNSGQVARVEFRQSREEAPGGQQRFELVVTWQGEGGKGL